MKRTAITITAAIAILAFGFLTTSTIEHIVGGFTAGLLLVDAFKHRAHTPFADQRGLARRMLTDLTLLRALSHGVISYRENKGIHEFRGLPRPTDPVVAQA